jgi:hypothetical protein
MTRSLPPSHAHGMAVATSASGCQWSPKAGPPFEVIAAPANANHNAYNAAHKGMLHEPIRREPRRDAAADDTIDHPIGCRKRQERISIDQRLAPRRKDAGRVQHEVGTDSDKDSYDDAG